MPGGINLVLGICGGTWQRLVGRATKGEPDLELRGGGRGFRGAAREESGFPHFLR
jgi:hypothetical protein